MNSALSLGLILLVALALLLWLLGGARRGSAAGGSQTEETEDEVRDVNAFTSADDAEEELRDWGPGAPKS